MKLSANKKKIIVLTSMVLLLVMATTLNFLLNNNAKNPDINVETTFFAQHRTLRESSRAEQLAIFDAVISSATSTAEAKATAEADKMTLCKLMEKELMLESLVKAKGFNDVVVTMSTTNCNIVVNRDNMTEVDAAVIYEIITRETQFNALNVIITPIATENM